MPFDGSGTFNRDRSWVSEATANIKIRSDNHDIHDTDLANGLTHCITKNGSTQPTADIPMNSHKLINLGQPINAQDAATKTYVDNFREFSTSIRITGADANGQVIFSSATGANGLSWSAAGTDMSFVTRKGKASETTNRWVFNNKADASANPNNDVMRIDERGMIGNNGQLSNNLSYDGVNYRVISPGYGNVLTYTGGDFKLSSNDIATITNPYVTATLRLFFQALNIAGSTEVRMAKSASGKANFLQSYTGTELRWSLRMGDTTPESGSGYVGSNFYLLAYDNAGANGLGRLHIARDTGKMTTYGDLQTAGQITTDSIVQSTDTTMIVAAASGGAVYLRPNGSGSTSEQVVVNTDGNLVVSEQGGIYAGYGIHGRTGYTGSYGVTTHWINFYWDGSDLRAYYNSSLLGYIAWQSDYRMKKNIKPLPSMWDKVKSLKPISYQQKKWSIFEENERVRWGFAAHELQEHLTKEASNGEKDGEEIQQPNPWVVIAALTKALQEAMGRIEALETAA